MCITKPAEELYDEVEDVAEDLTHGAGDVVEDVTGIDLDWDDNVGGAIQAPIDFFGAPLKPSIRPIDNIPEPLQDLAAPITAPVDNLVDDVEEFGDEFIDTAGNLGEDVAGVLGDAYSGLLDATFGTALDTLGDLTLGILGPSAAVLNPSSWTETTKAKYPRGGPRVGGDYLADPRSKKYLGHRYSPPLQSILTGGQGVLSNPRKNGKTVLGG